METAVCNLIYVDRSVQRDRLVRASSTSRSRHKDARNGALDYETPLLRDNVELLLEVIGDVYLCSTGAACLTQLFDIHQHSIADAKPTVVIIDVPNNERLPTSLSRSRSRSRSRTLSPTSNWTDDDIERPVRDGHAYGTRLLQKIVSEAHLRNMSKLVVPISLVSFPGADSSSRDAAVDNRGLVDSAIREALTKAASPPRKLADRKLLKRCLDLGTADVMTSPLSCVTTIQGHAYRAHKEAAKERQAVLEVKRGRKRSWVGVDEQKPFAYLREAMVSGLMSGICRPGDDQDDRVSSIRISVGQERRNEIAGLISRWHFNAHALNDDELIVAAAMMLRHALAMPELEHWRLSSDRLSTFLIACRAAYNSFVPFHNFRHVVDVLQATFHFLVQIGSLPPYPPRKDGDTSLPPRSNTVANLIQPFEALTLLITAIGHDVGHPGVNNGFLVTLNAPLAQLYNDRSVLESFHCAAYSQILRRHWPAAFEDLRMRNLMISSILATDMGLHFDYMKKLGDLQEKLQENSDIDGWNGRMIEEQKALACALLIKCADISNVARGYETAYKWTHILADEFARQASMENELEIRSSLMAQPKKDVVSLSRAQLGFMNLFALPLFQAVADIMPQMRYSVEEVEINKRRFEEMIEEELAKQESGTQQGREGTLSPKTRSLVVTDIDQCNDSLEVSTDGACTIEGVSPRQTNVEEQPTTNPTSKPSHMPELSHGYREVNGIVTSFDAVADFAASDPFNMRESRALRQQRCSEATDGSASVPSGGDWASQATSATTGKMPLSPSTQGTSIISQESLDRPASVPVTMVTAPDDSTTGSRHRGDSKGDTDARSQSDSRLDISPALSLEEDSMHSAASTNGKLSSSPIEGPTLKKKPSRFRMNAFTFFRRHKGASPPLPAADTAG